MTTYLLLALFAYATGSEPGSGVALQSEKIDFFSREECMQARKDILSAAADAGYRRTVVVCMKRGNALLAPAQQ